MDGVDVVLYSILGFLALVLLGVIIFILSVLSQYKHTFVRKVKTGKKFIRLIDKVREWRDKETGVIYWRLLKAKHIIARPPPNAIEPTQKGNYYVEAVYMGDIDYRYLAQNDEKVKKEFNELRNKQFDNMTKDVKDIVKLKLLELKTRSITSLAFMKPTPIYYYTKETPIIDENVDTITTDQRLIAFNQVKTAYERKHQGIGQYLPMIAGISALVILIAVIFIFGADLIRPLVEFGDKYVLMTDRMADVATQLDRTANILNGLLGNRQYIVGEGQQIYLLNGTAAPN